MNDELLGRVADEMNVASIAYIKAARTCEREGDDRSQKMLERAAGAAKYASMIAWTGDLDRAYRQMEYARSCM